MAHTADPATTSAMTGQPPGTAARYRQRISGPLLDRLDLHVDLDRVAAARQQAAERDGVRVRPADDLDRHLRGG